MSLFSLTLPFLLLALPFSYREFLPQALFVPITLSLGALSFEH